MRKQKALKIMSASVIAGSAIVASSPVEAAAASNVDKLVKEAKELGTILKWAISIEGSADGKTRPMVAYNATKEAYDIAVNAIKTLTTAQKNTYMADLEKNVKVHINRTMSYIDALTAGEKIKEKQQALANQLDRNLINDDTEKAYHELTREIRKQALLLDRVYGQTTRDLIRSQYKFSAEKIRDNAMYAVTVKMAIDKASKALSEKDSRAAERYIDEARKYLNYVENSAIKNTLNNRFNSIAQTTVPTIIKVTASEPKRIKVEFNSKMLSGNSTNSAENKANYSVNGKTIKQVKLFDDKKTAIIELNEPLNTNSSYTVTIKKNIQTENNTALGSADTVTSIVFFDSGKPTVNFVTADPNGGIEIKFSELISASSPIAISIEGKTVTYSIYEDTDTVVVPGSEMKRLGLQKGNFYSIVFTGARDLVSPNANTMDTYNGRFYYNAMADTMPPEVRSIQAKDEKTFTLEFSEPLTDLAAANLVIMKGTTTIRPTSVKDVSGGLKTKYEIELPATIYTANEASALLNIQIKSFKDAANNMGNTTDRTVTMIRDLTPPQFVSINYDVDKNEIHVTFSKTLKTGSPLINKITMYDPDNLPFKPVVKQNVGNKMIIDAKNLRDGYYVINADAGAVKDTSTAQNDSLPFRVSVTKKADIVKPEVTIVQGANNGQFKAVFSEPVTEDTAKNLANYLINGSMLPERTTFEVSNDQKLVTITLPEGEIQTTNIYTIEVRGIKDLSDNEINPKQSTVTIVDNTLPFLQSAAVNNNNLILTFSENIVIPTNQQINLKKLIVDGTHLSMSSYSVGVNGNELILTPRNQTLFISATIVVETDKNSWITDQSGNVTKDSGARIP
ncbi:Ig-like domain-containing protein [Bacillus sp. FJAT-29937]|uniref:Ig-like domain-containing protein n=1 Tax=Bacillus sp. FJAT-29937 TaxID=1720553 RepID=UPI00082A262D|nr:Ig-like domain-containing protein [Bacillus sp. FJAT-29937]